MANKPPKSLAGSIGNTKYYYTKDGLIVDEAGKPVSDRIVAVFNTMNPVKPGMSPQEKKEPEKSTHEKIKEESKVPSDQKPKLGKSTLDYIFPEIYKMMEKNRKATKEEQDKESQQTKKNQTELRLQFESIEDILKDNNSIVKEQLAELQRTSTLLSEIAQSIGGGGGMGFGGAGLLRSLGRGAATVGRGALNLIRNPYVMGATATAAVGFTAYNYFKGSNTNQAPQAPAAPEIPEPQNLGTTPVATPSVTTGSIAQSKETTAITAAKQKNLKPENILEFKGDQIKFNSDTLKFEVDKFTLDINGQQQQNTSSPDGGGGGNTPSGGGGGGSGAAIGDVKTPQGQFKSNQTTPSFAGIEGGKGAFQGFAGKSPTAESIKKDMDKTTKFTPTEKGAGSLKALIDQSAAVAGIDPRKMYGIVAGESKHGSGYDTNISSKEASYGPFQLNRKGGLGNVFEKETGLDVTDPKTLPAQAKWVANYLAKHPNMNIGRTWYGYKGDRDWNPNWGNAGYEGPERLKATTVAVKQTEIPASVSSMLGDMTAAATLTKASAPGFSELPTVTKAKASVRVADGSGLSPDMAKALAGEQSKATPIAASPIFKTQQDEMSEYVKRGDYKSAMHAALNRTEDDFPVAAKLTSSQEAAERAAEMQRVADKVERETSIDRNSDSELDAYKTAARPPTAVPPMPTPRPTGQALAAIGGEARQSLPSTKPRPLSAPQTDRNVDHPNAKPKGVNDDDVARIFEILGALVGTGIAASRLMRHGARH